MQSTPYQANLYITKAVGFADNQFNVTDSLNSGVVHSQTDRLEDMIFMSANFLLKSVNCGESCYDLPSRANDSVQLLLLSDPIFLEET